METINLPDRVQNTCLKRMLSKHRGRIAEPSENFSKEIEKVNKEREKVNKEIEIENIKRTSWN